MERDLRLFHANPPRMFPHVAHQRPKIDGMLRQLAAIDPEKYVERLEKYNALAEQYGVDPFPRVLVVQEVEAVEPVVTETVVGEIEITPTPVITETVVEKPKKKKSKKIEPVAEQDEPISPLINE